MSIEELILSDFRTLCRYTREHEGFIPIPKSMLTKRWGIERDEEYRDFLCDALRYYFDEKTYRKFLREEIGFDEIAVEHHEKQRLQNEAAELQPEAVVEVVDGVTENCLSSCTALVSLL
jgi:hypothetical protein